jgi:hypothetical protein
MMMDLARLQQAYDILRLHLMEMDTLQELIASQREPDNLAWQCQRLHEHSFSARALLDKLLGDLGLTDGAVRLSDVDRARAGLPAND